MAIHGKPDIWSKWEISEWGMNRWTGKNRWMNRTGQEKVVNKPKNWEQNKKACGNRVLKALKSCASRAVVMWGACLSEGRRCAGAPAAAGGGSGVACAVLWAAPVFPGWHQGPELSLLFLRAGSSPIWLARRLRSRFPDKHCRSDLLLFYFLIYSQNDRCLVWLCLSWK